MTGIQPRSDGSEPSRAKATYDFSIVTAVYNVGRYLDEFIGSVEGQTLERDRFEVIAVDDGSTDHSLETLRRWERERPGLVKVITQENAGQAAARNAGMELANGQWVTFVDPDDVLDRAYLAEVAAFIEANPGASMYAANRLILDEASGEVANTHPLRMHFRLGNRIRDIIDYPEYFHGHAPTAFIPLDELRRLGVRFDPRIRPNFEDGHFCSAYLLGVSRPTIGFVETAHYLYRRRRDQTSTLQGSFADPGRYTTVMRYGFLDILERGVGASESGSPPEWLQNFVLYELSWYFSSQDAHAGVTAAVGDVADQFHALMREVLGYLDKDVVAGFSVRPMKPAWIDILLHAYDAEPWHQEYAHVTAFDDGQSLVRLSYRFCGRPPVEELFSGGAPVRAKHAKTRDLVYHGRTLMMERIVWLSARRSVRVKLDDRDLDLQFSVPQRRNVLRPGEIVAELSRDASALKRRARNPPPSLVDRVVRRLARSRPIRHYLRRSWVVMDRIADAGDSGERLFQHIRATRPDIRAWFVIASDAPEWRRLRREHGLRVLAHGSLRWKLVMVNCENLISSHIDVPIVRPQALMRFMRPRWRFTFLQHGVIKDDLSSWLNPKAIDMFVTSTPQEYASIAGDHTPYVFTTKEVKLTGLPRFDRLLEMGERFDDRRDLVLVAPTWRVKLVQPLQAGAHTREIDPAFFDSEFARNWLGLLRSDELAALCDKHGLRIGFLPHPVLQPALPGLDLPDHVLRLSFADNDVQELFARAAVMVTDYSSMAFNAAYINRALVYFQFDHERVGSGEHLGRRGYFDYERDGFGPVTYTVSEALSAIGGVLEGGRSPSPTYQARIDAAFPLRDGRCCERVIGEIEALSRRMSPAEASVPVETPASPAPAFERVVP